MNEQTTSQSKTKTSRRVKVKTKPTPERRAVIQELTEDGPSLTGDELDVLNVVLHDLPEGQTGALFYPETEREVIALRCLENRGLLKITWPIYEGASFYVERVAHADEQLFSQARYGRRYEARLRRAERA